MSDEMPSVSRWAFSGVAIGKAACGMLVQAINHMGSQGAFAHVGERLGVDDVIVVAGAQQARGS